MHPFSTPWKHQKNLRYVFFQRVEKWCIGNEWVNWYQQLLHSFYQISWVAIIRGGNWLDENFSRWEFPVWELCGWQFSGWEFSWVGVVWVGIFWVGVFLDESCPGGNFSGGSFPGWELSSWDLSWVEIFFGGSFPDGNCPVRIIRVAIFQVRVFILTKWAGLNDKLHDDSKNLYIH